jgi:uncharacterized repeat protein (TIGR01451 family)
VSQHLPTSIHALRRRALDASRRTRLAVTVVAVLAAALALVVAVPSPASAGPQPVMTGFVPLPGNDYQEYLESVNTDADTTLDFTVGITNAATGSVLYYDQWEDGFEADLANPTQSSTLVFGDGVTGNGNAASYQCSVCAGDLLPQGAALIMRNTISTPRPTSSAPVRFDGGDKVASTRGFAITAGGFTTPLNSVLSGVVSAYDTSKYGTRYTVPVGEDTPLPPSSNDAFEYAGASIMTGSDGTTIDVDEDGDGDVDLTETRDAGDSLFVDGGLSEGATIRSSAPVQVHLLTGNVDSEYEARSYTLFPDSVLSNDYLSPAGTGGTASPTANYLYNPSASPLTVTPQCTGCSGTIAIPANSSASFTSPANQAVRFSAPAGRTFIALAAIGARGTGNNPRQWDWGYTMIPTSQLTTQVVLGWAPGNSNNPPTLDDDDERFNPVWVTATDATTIYVDFDGNPATGTIDAAPDDCFGDRHDQVHPVSALESLRLWDPNDADMTSARIYTCDGTPLAGAWGEDPTEADAGAPGFDAGYTIIPTTTMLVEKTAALVDDVDDDGGFGPGDTMTYEIAIADAGSLAFTDVHLEDVLPPGIEYVPDSTTIEVDGDVTPIADDMVPPEATAFPLDNNVGLPNIDAGATVYVRFEAAISEPWSLDSSVLGNTACVVAQEAQACDTSQTQLTTADVSLTKEETADPQYAGEQAVFDITVSNAGPDDAPGVEVTDLLPDGLTYVSDDSNDAYDPETGIWTVGTVPNGGSVTLSITAAVDTEDPIENFAQVTGGGFVDPDSTPGEDPLGPNDPPNEDDEGSAEVDVAPAADLWLEKEEVASPSHVGDQAQFEITVGNDGVSDATGIEVTDLLPAGLTYVSDDGQGAYDAGTGIWNVGGLAAGDEVTLTILATVQVEDELLTNVAEITAADQEDPDSTPDNGEVDGEDDWDDASVSTESLIDLSLSKTQTATPAPAHVGDAAQYTITVHNGGPSAATGVEVTDQLPSGVDVEGPGDAQASQGTYDLGTGIWDLGELEVGESATLVIDATVNVLSSENVAEITAATEDDADSTPDNGDVPGEDDRATVPLELAAEADLSLTKTVDDEPTYVGEEVTFELVVTNDGPSLATAVQVTDLLPAGFTYESDDGGGDYDSLTGIWDVGGLAVGGSATLHITATITDTVATNVAEITRAGEHDPDSTPDNDDPEEDDQAEVPLEVDPLVDLSLVKSATPPTNQGEQGTFTLSLTNGGPSTATNVEVTDLLPAGVTYVSDDSADAYDPATGVWNVGSLGVGSTTTLNIVVTVDDLSVTNYAQVSAAEEDDRDSQPDTDTLSDQNGPDQDDESEASMEVDPTADLELTKSASPAEVDQGDSTTFTIVVSNQGPSTATNVVVEDVLPAGVTFEGSDASQGGYSSGTGIWTVGQLGVGETATLDIDVTVDDAGDAIRNVAEVVGLEEHDRDSTPDNGEVPGEDDWDDATISSDPMIDLELTKEVEDDRVHVGDETTYTVTVDNEGPSGATGVEVTDLLPAGVDFVSADPSQGSYDDATGVWTVGSLDVDEKATLEITVEVLAPGAITNVAEVTADGEEEDVDSTPGNGVSTEDDQAEVGITGIRIDLELDIVADATEVDVGDEVAFTVTLVNQGPSPATGVSVADLLPPGLTFVSASTATGSYSGGVWDVGGLPVGTPVTLQVTARVTAAGPLAYGAQVETATEPDRDSTPSNDEPGEDDQDVVTLVGIEADLSLTKTVDDPNPGLGERVTYTITVTNGGPSTATNVLVDDDLPEGVEWVSDTSGGAYDPATGEWTVGTLANGASSTLSITVRTTRAGAIANRASVIEVDQPDPNSTPGNDDPTEDDEDTVTVTPEPASVAGRVWLDEDGDGRFDEDESPIPGVVVLLFDDDGDLVASVETDDEGRYRFTGLPVGDYAIVIDEDTLPATIDGQTYDPDDVVDGRHEVTLVAGEQVVDVDFGYVPATNPIQELEEVIADFTDDVLARTGADALWQVRLGLGLLMLGGGLLLLARRRRPAIG